MVVRRQLYSRGCTLRDPCNFQPALLHSHAAPAVSSPAGPAGQRYAAALGYLQTATGTPDRNSSRGVWTKEGVWVWLNTFGTQELTMPKLLAFLIGDCFFIPSDESSLFCHVFFSSWGGRICWVLRYEETCQQHPKRFTFRPPPTPTPPHPSPALSHPRQAASLSFPRPGPGAGPHAGAALSSLPGKGNLGLSQTFFVFFFVLFFLRASFYVFRATRVLFVFSSSSSFIFEIFFLRRGARLVVALNGNKEAR